MAKLEPPVIELIKLVVKNDKILNKTSQLILLQLV